MYKAEVILTDRTEIDFTANSIDELLSQVSYFDAAYVFVKNSN